MNCCGFFRFKSYNTPFKQASKWRITGIPIFSNKWGFESMNSERYKNINWLTYLKTLFVIMLINTGLKPKNPLNDWAVLFSILSPTLKNMKKKPPPEMLNCSLSFILHGCFLSIFLSFALLRVSLHGCRGAALPVRSSQKKPAAIFKAAHRFQASTLRPVRTNQNETQWRDWLLLSPTFYHRPVWHIYGNHDAVTWGYSPFPGREGLAWKRNFWKVGFGLGLPPPGSPEHHVPWAAEELGWRCTRQPRGCCARSPLCLQSFPYPRKHERGAVTDTKPCTKHCGGAPVWYSLEINSLLTYMALRQSRMGKGGQQWGMSRKSDLQPSVGWSGEHPYRPVPKMVGKTCLLQLYTKMKLPLLDGSLIPSQAFVQDTACLPARQRQN